MDRYVEFIQNCYPISMYGYRLNEIVYVKF